MKHLLQTSTNIENKCQSTSKVLQWPYSWLRFLWEEFSSLSIKSQLQKVSARVFRALAAIPAALSNDPRKFVALSLILIGPFAEVAYRLLDKTPVTALSYWSPYWYLFAIGPDVFIILCATGFFLLMPELDKTKFAFIIPVGYKVTKILYLLFFVTDDEAFHTHVPFALMIAGFGIGGVWLFIAEYMVNLHFHKRTAPIARIEGLVDCPGMSDADKVKNIRPQLSELRARLTGQGPQGQSKTL